MPQDSTVGCDHRTTGSPLPGTAHPLGDSEVDSFLRFLFGDFARRPKHLKLSETAAVVRYLRRLALDGVPREVAAKGAGAIARYRRTRRDSAERSKVDQVAMALWGTLLQYGRVPDAEPKRVSVFIREHEKTYLSVLDSILPTVLDFIDRFEIPSTSPNPFRPPELISTVPQFRLEIEEGGYNYVSDPYLHDDTTERIYAAYHVLKHAGVKLIRPRIAAALTTLRTPCRFSHQASKPNRDVAWSPERVNDRIKEFDRRTRKELERRLNLKSLVQTNECMRQYQGHLISYWLSSFDFVVRNPF